MVPYLRWSFSVVGRLFGDHEPLHRLEGLGHEGKVGVPYSPICSGKHGRE